MFLVGQTLLHACQQTSLSIHVTASIALSLEAARKVPPYHRLCTLTYSLYKQVL
jgi:hypothetical protein